MSNNESDSGSKSIDVGGVFTMDVALDDDMADTDLSSSMPQWNELHNRTREKPIKGGNSGARRVWYGNQTSSRSYTNLQANTARDIENHNLDVVGSEKYGIPYLKSSGKLFDEQTDDVVKHDILIDDVDDVDNDVVDDKDEEIDDDAFADDVGDDIGAQSFLGRRPGCSNINRPADQRGDDMMANYEMPMPSFASTHDDDANAHHTEPFMTMNSTAYQSRHNRYNMHDDSAQMSHKLSASMPIQVPVCKPRVFRDPENYFDDVNEDYAYDSGDCLSNVIDPRHIPKSIEALARSVRDSTHVFGDLPRRRLNTGDLVRSLRPM